MLDRALVESPDDGGWYAEVVNGVGRDVFQTDVYPSANAALKVARERQAQREVLSR